VAVSLEIEKTVGDPVMGIDEAGRGPLAGGVYAAAVSVPLALAEQLLVGAWSEINDSKKLTEKKREALFDPIREQAIAYGVAYASVEEIEELNILNATFLAMNRAIEQLSPAPELALIDGNRNTGIRVSSRCIVKGDARFADIAAASILAKVSRDRFMLQMAEQYPEYGFEQHKGYGTKLHYERLRQYGPSPIHRPSFLRKMH
jgi:ribonuclease HII